MNTNTNNKKRLYVTIDEILIDQLQHHVDQYGFSKSAIVEKMLIAYLETAEKYTQAINGGEHHG